MGSAESVHIDLNKEPRLQIDFGAKYIKHHMLFEWTNIHNDTSTWTIVRCDILKFRNVTFIGPEFNTHMKKLNAKEPLRSIAEIYWSFSHYEINKVTICYRTVTELDKYLTDKYQWPFL
jgi:hypothetical protein